MPLQNTLSHGFIPLGGPKAFVKIRGELVDLRDNHLLWHYYADVSVPVQGEWDQPPHYPNFDAALNEAVGIAAQEMLDHFSENA